MGYQYDPANIRIINTGSSWRMDFSSDGTNLSGGPLKGNYKILQMHAHWGCAGAGCSEHTVDGHQYEAELHIVPTMRSTETPARQWINLMVWLSWACSSSLARH